MARIFLAISILLTLLSGVLSIQTRGKVKGIREDLSTARTTVTTVSAERDKARTTAKAAEEKATDAVAKKEQAETQLTAAKSEAEKATKDLTETKTALEDKAKALAEAKDALAKATTAQPAPTPNPETETKLKEMQVALQEKDAVTKKLEENAKAAQAEAKVLKDEKEAREKQIMKPGLEGTVLAVNSNWNFVVLSMGDHQGVLPNSTMIVKRGGSMVAKVRVTAVEPITSIADIVPGSLHKGNSVQPGDVVIFN